MSYDLTAPEREKHRGMMTTPGDWPYWPVLPLKRINNEDGYPRVEVGTLFAVEGKMSTVFIGPYLLAKGPTIKDAMDSFPDNIRYDDVDSVLDAGWIVD